MGAALAATGEISVVIFGGWCRSHSIRAVKPAKNLQVIFKPRDQEWRIGKLAWSVSGFWRRRAFAKALKADPDTLYHPGLYAYDPWIARRAAGLVFTVHDMQIELSESQGRHALEQTGLKQKAGADADRIVCVSINTQKDLERLVPAAKGKTSVVYLGSSLGNSVREVFGSPPYFLVVGNRHGYKNGRLVMESFARLADDFPSVRLKLCGGKPAGSDGEFDFEGSEKILSRIDWVQLDDNGLAAAYGAALALLYPSDYEGFGLPVLEAMRCGCPVITTRVSSLPEVGGDAVLYIEPRNGAQLSQQMRRLLHEPDLREELSKAGLARSDQFSWQGAARDALVVYRETLALGRQRK